MPLPPAPTGKITVLGIDPGLSGAFVIFDGKEFASFAMPIRADGKDKRIHFGDLMHLLLELMEEYDVDHAFLERAVSFGMGTKAAFNYGRGFEAITIAIGNTKLPFTLVEPKNWTKEMHAGISADLKPKVKSAVAVERLYPKLVDQLPRKKGKLLDGPVDALLIAGYGLRKLGATQKFDDQLGDFF